MMYMSDTMILLVLLLMLATLGVLVSGLVVMAIGGEIDRKYSNRLMVARVTFQALAIGAMGLAALVS